MSLSSRLKNTAGFTLIELLVVLAILATLLSLAAPRYAGSVDKAREAVLKENLAGMRTAIDRHFADTGRYPESLADLVAKRYLRKIPDDPVTDSAATWVIVAPGEGQAGGVADIRSGATGKARNGTQYRDW